MNPRTKREAESVIRRTDDQEASVIIQDLLDYIEDLEYQLEKADERIADLESDVDKWQNDARDWEDKYYEVQQD